MATGITNNITTVAFFFTLNGRRVGRPKPGLFHMRKQDTQAVRQLAARGAGFSEGEHRLCNAWNGSQCSGRGFE